LFLAELYAASGTSEARHTALGAMLQALSSADTLPLKSRLGLYTGSLGIVFAAARVGTLLGEQELRDRAAQLLHKCVHERQQEREFDLLSGDAGAIVACLLLREMLDDASLLDLAVWLGDELLQNADNAGTGSSWRSPGLPDRHNLTGFSHGTAGIGYALLELFHGTGDVKYRAAAERAFAYERSWFNAEQGNWPDLRGEGKQRKRHPLPLAFATYWCHGAPGIGMARLRAYELLNDATCKDEARVALHTTYTQLKATLHAGNGNFSLCHGLTGSAEVLLYGRQVLGQEWTDTSMLALEVAEAGIDASKRRGGAWSCGITMGETPGLLLGLAGIGHFYLRLHNPAIPSVLLLRGEDFRLEHIASSSFLTEKSPV
jgi:lantibiotic biosynthesis protein